MPNQVFPNIRDFIKEENLYLFEDHSNDEIRGAIAQSSIVVDLLEVAFDFVEYIRDHKNQFPTSFRGASRDWLTEYEALKGMALYQGLKADSDAWDAFYEKCTSLGIDLTKV